MGDSKLQFVNKTCDVTCCIHPEGVLDSLLFRLDIFQVFLFISNIFYDWGEPRSLDSSH